MEEEKKEGKNKLFLMLIILQAVTLFALIGLGAFVFVNMKKISSSPVKTNPAQEKKKEVKKEKKKEEILCSLEPFIVNLMDNAGRRYLKVKMDLIVSSKETEEEIKKKDPDIRDVIIMTLSGKTFSDVAGIEGKMRLKKEIKENLNKVLTSGKVLKVYFTEFVIQ